VQPKCAWIKRKKVELNDLVGLNHWWNL